MDSELKKHKYRIFISAELLFVNNFPSNHQSSHGCEYGWRRSSRQGIAFFLVYAISKRIYFLSLGQIGHRSRHSVQNDANGIYMHNCKKGLVRKNVNTYIC